jgi:6-phosphogluconolactonase (cycloisomerase 2 family)
MFERDPNSGLLTFILVLKKGQDGVEGLDGARSVTVSTDGQSVYVAGKLDDAVAVFERDPNSGLLTFVQVLKNGQDSVYGLDGARSVTVSTDGQSVYVASYDDDAVAVFGRDLNNGQLTLIQVLKDGQDGVEGLNGARSVTVSTDGQSVYVASSLNDTVAMFERDPNSGQLTPIQVLKDGQDGVEGLDGAISVTVSTDGQSVYVASYNDDAVAMFERDSNSGLLTFIQVFKDGQNGVEGLDGAYSVTVSTDGQSAYVTSYLDAIVTVFGRDPNSGQLTFQQAIFDTNQVLSKADSITISPDDHFVYVTSYDNDAVAVFERTNQPPQNILPTTPIEIKENTDFIFEQLSIDDHDARPLSVQVTLAVTPGTLTLSTMADLEFEQGDGTEDSQLTMTGTITAINEALTGMIFTPTPNFSGEATLQITTDDLGHIGYGNHQRTSDTLTITVLPINEFPVIEPLETQYGSPTQLLSFPVKATDPDVPKQNLTYELINHPPAGATIDSKTGQFSWTPLPNQIDSFEVTIQVTDDGINPDNLTATQTVNIIITDKPTLESLADQTITVDSPLTFAVKAHFPGTQALNFSLTDAPDGTQIDRKTGVFTWTPTQTGNFTATVVVTEPVGNTTAEAIVTIKVTAIPTSLDLDLDSFAIFQNGDLTAEGWLKGYAPQVVQLSNLSIQLLITAPDGNMVTPTVNTSTAGHYEFSKLTVFDQTGIYQLQAQFVGNERFAPSQSTILPLTVESLAGYALLVEGRDAQGNGQLAYGKSLNRVYQHLKNRGFVDPNIDYLSYDEHRAGVDERPDKAKVQSAFSTLQTRMNADPAPLYIVAVDHGDAEGNFYLDNGNGDKISPTELDNWLTTLEQGLSSEAQAQPRIIIIGSCYSGKMIPTLSKPGRIIITSTADNEVSYKGPKEPDEVRSGEYFIEALFAQFAQGQSLKTAFELATQSTELFTRADDFTVFHGQFQDNATQHPLLDDNDDSEGSNVLGTDGQKAKTIYLGLGKRYDQHAPDNPAAIWTVSPTIYLDANQTATRLSARVNRPSRVKDQRVWIDIRPPTLQLSTDGTEQSESQAIQGLIRHHLKLVSGNKFSSVFHDFTEAGCYEIFYFVIDSETDASSPLHRSQVCKDRAGNLPPTPVQLLNPTHHSESATTVIFNWQKSTDPDGDPLTYTLLLATEPSFQNLIYQQTGLITTMTYLNADSVIDDPLNQGQLGLRDGTEYAWKVQTIDKYGAMSESEVFTFRTNDTNFPPGLGSLYVYNAVNFISLENATLDFWRVDERGNLIYDDTGTPIPVAQPPEVFQDQGVYNMMLPYGRRRATLRIDGYQAQPVLIDTTEGLANLQVAMTPLGGIPTQPGQLEFALKQTQIEETRGEIALLVNRVNGKDGTVSVAYELVPNGSASFGDDYSVPEGQLTWTNQDRSPQKIPITIHDDDQPEGEESFTLRLTNPSGNAQLGATATITITLVDDETTLPQNPGVLQFLTTQYAASESDTTPVVIVTRTDGNNGRVAVDYLVTGQSTAQFETDYTGGNGTLTWDNGDDEPKRVQLILVDDDVVEELETLHLTLANPIKGAILGEHQRATLTITDNDVGGAGPGMVQFSQSDYQAHEEDSSLQTVTVIRTAGNQGQVSVQYQVMADSTATEGSDYTLSDTKVLTWEDGDSEAKIIKVVIVDDPEMEVAETIQFRLLNPSDGVKLGDLAQATLTISDNDSMAEDNPQDLTVENQPLDPTAEDKPIDKLINPAAQDQPLDSTAEGQPIDSTTESRPTGMMGETTQLVDELGNPITPTPIYSEDTSSNSVTVAGTLQFVTDTYYLNEGIGPVSAFTVIRSGGNQGTVSVEYAISGGTAERGLDYQGGTGLLTWPEGDDVPKAINLKVLDDQAAEPSETLQIQLQNPTGDAQLGIYDQATLVITDNDPPNDHAQLVESSLQSELEFTLPSYWVQEEDKTAQLTVTRTGSSQGEVSVQYIATINSSATLDEDYHNGKGTLVWVDGDMQPQTITLELNDDDRPEEEIIHLLLIQPRGAAVLGKFQETLVVIQDDDTDNGESGTEPPTSTTIQFTAQFASVAEQDHEVLIPVIRTGTQGEASVKYETIAGSATADEDYLSSQGRLVWQDGEEGIRGLIIPIVPNRQPEPEEHFTLRLFNPSEGVQLGQLSQVEIRIEGSSKSPDLPLKPLLPNLGRGMAVINDPLMPWQIHFHNCQTLPCPLKVAFRGGSSLNGLSYYSQLTLHPYQYVNIRGEIDVAAEHVGQSAKLLLVVAWQPLDSLDPEYYFMQDRYGQILPWNLNLAHLVAAQEAVTLTPSQEVSIYTGFLERGQIRLFFGYQLPDGVIVYNGEQAVELVVKDLAVD